MVTGELAAYHDGGGEVLLKEEQGGVEVRVVELVGHAPANSSELASLLDNAVEEGLDVEQRAPAFVVDLVQGLLSDHRIVRAVKSRLESRGRL
jgi:hypothetical protein